MDWFRNQTSTITTANGLHLNDFDLWDDPGTGEAKNPNPINDHKIDCIFIIWKNHPLTVSLGNCASGAGVASYNDAFSPGYPYNSSQQFGIIGDHARSNWLGCDYDHVLYTFTAEFLHGLFGSNNWHTSGGADIWSFLKFPHAYCTTEQYDGMTNMWCGFDRNHLGWKYPGRQYLISGLDPVTNNEKDGDLNWQGQTTETEYLLRDFSVTGDMVRIKLPFFDWQATGDRKNQYLWIENHQMVSSFDDFHFHYLPYAENMTKGLYMSIEVGKDHKISDDLVHENIFYGFDDNTYLQTANYNSHPNRVGSWMMPIPAEGFYDFKYRIDLVGTACGNNPTVIPIDKTLSIPNPLTGFSDQFNIYDDGSDNQLSRDKNPDLAYAINGQTYCAGQGNGDSHDAFTFNGNKKISICTNPSSASIYTYVSAPYDPNYDGNSVHNTWESRKIDLSGLSIEIIDEIPDNTYGVCHDDQSEPNDLKIKIRWDDYDVSNDVRWCGNIELHPSVHYTSGVLTSNDVSLHVLSGNTVTLDRGKSPTQHVAYEQDPNTGEYIFTQPTYFTADAYS